MCVNCLNAGCGLNFHKRCAVNIPNNCSRLKTATGEFAVSPATKKTNKEVWSGRPLWIDRALQERPELPHTFAIKTYTSLTACYHCKRLVSGHVHATHRQARTCMHTHTSARVCTQTNTHTAPGSLLPCPFYLPLLPPDEGTLPTGSPVQGLQN